MPRKVLIADDDRVYCTLLSGLLQKWGYDVTVVRNGVEAHKQLHSPGAARLAILDWIMPGLDGLQVVRQLRRDKHAPYTFVILLTVKRKRSDILHGLNAGADDYLAKPFDAQELRARLRVGERIIDLQQRLTNALERSEFTASHDFLTGLYNRATAITALRREMVQCERRGNSLGVFIIDADHFKTINDKFGHLAGDEVLKQLCLRIQSALRSYDILGRYGGEEFLVVAPDCDSDNAASIAERIRSCVADQKLDVGNAKIAVTVSIGVVTVQGTSPDVTALLQAADHALYAAKDKGRNRWTNVNFPIKGTPATLELLTTSATEH